METKLQQGEYQIGRYKVRYAEFSGLGWCENGPWMRMAVTNRRLLFLPDDPRDSIGLNMIERSHITQVWNVCLGRRDGVILALRDGKLVYLFIEWAQGGKLTNDIREMLTPPLQPSITPRGPGKPFIN